MLARELAMHEALISRLRSRPELHVSEQSTAWSINLSTRTAWRFVIIIPREMLEWFVDAWSPDLSDKVWSDWCEWYSCGGEPPEIELPSYYARDVEHFIERVLQADELRVHVDAPSSLLARVLPRSSHLQVRRGEEWTSIEPGELPAV